MPSPFPVLPSTDNQLARQRAVLGDRSTIDSFFWIPFPESIPYNESVLDLLPIQAAGTACVGSRTSSDAAFTCSRGCCHLLTTPAECIECLMAETPSRKRSSARQGKQAVHSLLRPTSRLGESGRSAMPLENSVLDACLQPTRQLARGAYQRLPRASSRLARPRSSVAASRSFCSSKPTILPALASASSSAMAAR
jgi:hypothetical protein